MKKIYCGNGNVVSKLNPNEVYLLVVAEDLQVPVKLHK